MSIVASLHPFTCGVPLLISLLLVASPSFGQPDQKAIRKIYAQMAVGPTVLGGHLTNFGIQTVLKKNGTLSFSFQDFREPTMEMDVIFNWPDWMPGRPYPLGALIYQKTFYRVTVYSATAGKCYELGKSVWFTSEAGVSVAKDEQVTIQWGEIGPGVYTPFPPERETHITAGGLFRADLNWAFSSFAGLGIGAFVWINTLQSHAGMEIKLMGGLLKRKPRAIVKSRN